MSQSSSDAKSRPPPPRQKNKPIVVVVIVFVVFMVFLVQLVLDVWDNIGPTAKVKPSALNGIIQTADEKVTCTVKYCNLICSKK